MAVHLERLLFVGIGSLVTLVEDTSAADIAAALDQVGARLKRVRTQRRMTLWVELEISDRVSVCSGDQM